MTQLAYKNYFFYFEVHHISSDVCNWVAIKKSIEILILGFLGYQWWVYLNSIGERYQRVSWEFSGELIIVNAIDFTQLNSAVKLFKNQFLYNWNTC